MKLPSLNLPFLPKLKQVFICLLAVYAVAREVIVLQDFVGNALVTYGIFCVGMGLVGLDIISSRSFFRARYMGWLLAFLAVSILSALLNYRYGLVDNIKTLGWMTLFFLLVYPTGVHEDPKIIRSVFLAFSLAMTIVVVLSLPMYFYDVGYTYHKANGIFTDQGFSFLYFRLWGLFQEANYAAVYAELACFASVYLAIKTKKKWVSVLVALQTVLLLSFVVLSGSRTAKLVLMMVAAWMAFYGAQRLLSAKGLKKLALSLGAGALAVMAVLAVLQGLMAGLPYVKVAMYSGMTDRQVLSIHTLYDRVYAWGNVNVAESSSERLFSYLEQMAPSTSEDETDTPGNTASSLLKPVVTPINRTDLDDEDVSNGRLKRWKDGLDVFWKVPILGASPRGVFAFAETFFPESYIAKYRYSITNSYLEVLAGTGLLGAVAIFGFLLLTAIHVVKTAWRESFCAERMILHGVALTVVLSAVLESDLFFGLTAGAVVCWIVLGMLNGPAEKKPDFAKLKKLLCRREKK